MSAVAQTHRTSLVSVEELTKDFPIGSRALSLHRPPVLRAVDRVSFEIEAGETLGLVGESGSGKTTTGQMILRLQQATSGRIVFEGTDVTRVARGELRQLRRRMQVVFQDPRSSLSPRMTVHDAIEFNLHVHGVRGPQAERRIGEVLEWVGLAQGFARRYPHQLSGGQLQRVAIARALALGPVFVLLDEAVSALDVSIQAQILNLLRDIQREHALTYLFISHDLAVVEYLSNRTAVMFAGQIVEIADRADLYQRAVHPYTRELLAAVPSVKAGLAAQAEGERESAASDARPVGGCAFRLRCPLADDRCAAEEPALRLFGEGHRAACHKGEQIVAARVPAAPGGARATAPEGGDRSAG